MQPQHFSHAVAAAAGQHGGLPAHLAGMGGQLAGLAGLSGPAAIQAMANLGGLGGLGGLNPGSQNNVPPPPGGLGSGLLALGSVAGALVGHNYNNNQYNNQVKDEKDADRTV